MFLPLQMRGETRFFHYRRVIYETEASASLTARAPQNNENIIRRSVTPKSGTK